MCIFILYKGKQKILFLRTIVRFIESQDETFSQQQRQERHQSHQYGTRHKRERLGLLAENILRDDEPPPPVPIWVCAGPPESISNVAPSSWAWTWLTCSNGSKISLINFPKIVLSHRASKLNVILCKAMTTIKTAESFVPHPIFVITNGEIKRTTKSSNVLYMSIAEVSIYFWFEMVTPQLLNLRHCLTP